MTIDTLRVAIAPGPGRGDGAGGSGAVLGARARTVVAVRDGQASLVGSAEPETARLVQVALPRARLETAYGTHDVLLLGMPDAGRAAAGLQRIEVVIDGWRFEVETEEEHRAALRDRATRAREDAGHRGPLELRAIIPGRVLSVEVADGDTVEAGQRVLVLEAMKMQNELRSPRAGVIAGLAVGAGQTVELGDRLLVIE